MGKVTVGVKFSNVDRGNTMVALSDDVEKYPLYGFVLDGKEIDAYPVSNIRNTFVIHGEYEIGDTIEIRTVNKGG